MLEEAKRLARELQQAHDTGEWSLWISRFDELSNVKASLSYDERAELEQYIEDLAEGLPGESPQDDADRLALVGFTLLLGASIVAILYLV